MAQEKQLSTIVEGKGEVPFSPKVNSSTVYDENGQPLNTILQSVRNKIKECSSSIGEQREKIGGLQTIVDEAATIAKESSDAISQSQEYMQQLNEAIADLPDGQAVSAEVADHEIRVSGLEANSATKEEVTSKYGDYSDISEFVAITTDADDKILEGFKRDGTKVFTGDVDAPNIRQLDTDVTQAKSQAQDAATAAQQATEQVAGMAEDVGEAKSQAQSAVEQTQQLSQDVVEKYGDYQDVSEFLDVKTDSQDRILEVTKRDGTKVFMGDVDAPNIRQLGTEVQEAKESTEWFNKSVNAEWAEVHQDSNGRIIMGVKRDGTVFIQKLDSPELDNTITQKIIEIVGNVNKDIVLKPSNFLPNSVRIKKGDTTIPDLSSVTLTIVNVNSQEDFDQALGLSEGGTIANDVLINLHMDVILDSTNLSIPSGRTVIINGNGHKIIGGNVEYSATATGSLIKGTYAYVPYTENYDAFLPSHDYQVGSYVKGINNGSTIYLVCKTRHNSEEDFAAELSVNGDKWNYFSPSGNNVFVAPNGDVLKLAKSDFYTAASEVAYNTGTEENPVWSIPPQTATAFANTSVYHCRFALPQELQSLSLTAEDNVYVNLTSDWTSVQTKVTKAEGGYLYFDYFADDGDNGKVGRNYIGIDNDYHVTKNTASKRFTSFFLINYQMNDNHSCLVKNGYLMFPNRYAKVYESTDVMFNLTASSINLKIFDAEISAAQVVDTSSAPLEAACNVIVDNCKIHGCKWAGVYLGKDCKGYITNCEFYDMDISSVNSKSTLGTGTYLLAIGNYLHNVGTRRNNSFGIKGSQYYYIARNKVVDFGYGALWGGQSGQNNPTPSNPTGSYVLSEGIIEYNTIYQTPEYFNEAIHHVPMDAGAIYVPTHNVEAIVRHNVIYGYSGRFGNRGIYLDDGCYNFFVYSNIVANTPNSYSITGRFADGNPYLGSPYTLDNVNKYILNNYVENGIVLGARTTYFDDGNMGVYHAPGETVHHGEPLEDNGCYLGYNIINEKMQTVKSVISGLMEGHQETQYFINIDSYQGVFSTSLDIIGWLNKL